jgi:hypothetical protein
MLTVTNVQPVREEPLLLEIDEYVPLRFRTYREPLGAAFLRLGNRSTTLLELIVEPYAQRVRGVTLTFFEKLSPWPSFSIESTAEGLPILATAFETYTVVELPEKNFDVSIREGEVLLFWSPLGACEVCEFRGRVRFLIQDGRLAGVWFLGLSREEIEMFSLRVR